MRVRYSVYGFLLVMLTVSTVIAQTACPVVVQEILTTVADSCTGMGRNEICYGNFDVSARTFRGDILTDFDSTGDRLDVSQVQSLTTAAYDADTDKWGIAILSLQADLPDTLPGQNITFVAFGDTHLTNAVVPDDVRLNGVAIGQTLFYEAPNRESNAVGTIDTGDNFDVIGRNSDLSWYLIETEEGVRGYMNRFVNLDGAPEYLPLFDADDTREFTAPMQIIGLSTGIGQPECTDVPPDGLLIQAPTGTDVALRINGIDMVFGSTGLIQIDGEDVIVSTFDGTVSVTSDDETQTAEPGYTVTASGEAAPSEPEPYDYDNVDNVPVELLPDAVTVPLPVDSNAGWVDSGIVVAAGEAVELGATGRVNVWVNCASEKVEAGQPDIDCTSLIFDPDGGDARSMSGEFISGDMARFPVEDAPPHSLVGRIGATTFVVGEGTTIIAESAGTLEFRLNDVDDNNAGHFIVTIDVIEDE